MSARFFASWRPEYPVWRHTLFIVIDASRAAIALVGPERLWFPLTLLLIQNSKHGRAVWTLWYFEQPIAWMNALVIAFAQAALTKRRLDCDLWLVL